MKKIYGLLLAGAMVLCAGTWGSAATITGTAPTTTDGTLNDALNTAFLDALYGADHFADGFGGAEEILAKYKDQDKLARGFANANAYASQAATFQGYQNYSIFAISTGVMAGVQLPSLSKSYYDDIDKKLENEGDLYAGVGAGAAFVNFGVNAGFITPGLYLSAKFGSFTVKPDDDSKVKNTLVGVGINYNLVDGTGLSGFFRWRGLSLGTGFLYNKSNVDYSVKVDKQIESFDAAGYTGNLILDPTVNLGLDVTTYTIPLDIVTSFQMLWLLNLTFGAGVDFTFGNSDIVLSSNGNVDVEFSSASIAVTPGTVVIDGSTKNIKPSFVRPRLMTGIGFNFGPLKVDVPVYWYIATGAAVGVTVGIVW